MTSRHWGASGGSPPRHGDASGRYARYTVEQVEVLEKVYDECPKPNNLRRQKLVSDFPVLANIEPKQIKIWFQNRRCRERQQNATSRLHSLNKKLAATNKMLMEENDRLKKQVTLLVSENGFMRQQLNIGTAASGGSSGDAITTLVHSPGDTNKPPGFQSIAEETLTKFLSKATGISVDWVQMPGMKPGPDSVEILAISNRCSGVAARACGLVNLDATKIAEILKDRACWSQDCRSIEVFATTATDNGGIIELVYAQTYAPTTLAQARDFWTLRYTTTLEDGSLVVCESSLSGSGAGPDADTALQFVRAEMLPSGYLIRPCEGGGSIIHFVDHVNLQPQNVPDVLQPLYESSEVVAQRMTIPALRYVRQIAQEATGDVAYAPGREPAILRSHSQKLSRGFNDAINGFSDDGWSQLGCDATENVTITLKSTKTGTSSSCHPSLGSILCAKASMLLKNVNPAALICFLRKHRSEWADFSVDSYCAATQKASSHPHSGRLMRPMRFSGSQIMMPLGNTIGHEQRLEVIRLESLPVGQLNASILGDVHLLQMCSEMNETSAGAYYELVFAPIDDMLPEDASLLPSGFRIIPLNVKSVEFITLSNPSLSLFFSCVMW
ncbi:hypothetical protein Leryth_009510 [Lithospermum erythrorhizon]|nr:hypothetical protein Leryth_009510 [Lithospermum erythrorhizon]